MYYVAYFGQGFPGEQNSDPERFSSVQAVKDGFREFARAVGRDYYDPYGTANATVYAFSDDGEGWEEAQRFAGVGIPFDYPSFLLSIGPREGTKYEHA
jgi:hypothetical protein